MAADAVFISAPPVPQPSVHENVLHYLRKLIITGELPPGAKIPLDAVARTCGVSLVPVREALRQLQTRGPSSTSPAAATGLRATRARSSRSFSTSRCCWSARRSGSGRPTSPTLTSLAWTRTASRWKRRSPQETCGPPASPTARCTLCPTGLQDARSWSVKSSGCGSTPTTIGCCTSTRTRTFRKCRWISTWT